MWKFNVKLFILLIIKIFRAVGIKAKTKFGAIVYVSVSNAQGRKKFEGCAKLSSPRRSLSRQDCHASWHILHGYRRQAKIRPEICHREDTRNCQAFVTRRDLPRSSSSRNDSRRVRGNNVKYDAINRLYRNYSNSSCAPRRMMVLRSRRE
jgi:hypothetical protein